MKIAIFIVGFTILPLSILTATEDSLMSAIKNSDFNRVKIIIDEGADISGKYGIRVLVDSICDQNNEDIPIYLINKGIDTNAVDNDGWSVLYYAASRGRGKVIKELISKGADIHVISSRKESILHAASYGGLLWFVQELVNQGFSVNKKDADNMTPLHAACERNHLEVVKYLIQKGADCNAEGRGGATPIFFSISGYTNNKLAVIQFLISKKADVNHKSMDGSTPLDIASKLVDQSGEKEEIINILKSAGGK